ncbi:FAD/NAD(P)-binding domain-containing protein [Ramaria rubella]|nr:FAD/NAD(P)-binding domain-containing protein [Ramaria rubella]
MTMDALYFGRCAAVSLNIVIVGGGPCGLATAFAFAKAGHECVVLESAVAIGQHHGAINIPSNLTKILAQWGVDSKELDNIACKPLGLEYLMYRTGKRFGGIEWNELVFDATGNDWYIADHADLHKMMFRLAEEAGVTIRLGCKVTSVDPREASVTLSSGEVIRGDLVVGADGDQSYVRDVVLERHDPGVSKGTAVFVTTIPVEHMLDDPELKALVDVPRMNEWMGPDRIMLAMPLKETGIYVIYLIHPQDAAVTEDWTTHDSVEKLQNDVVGWEPRVQKLMKLVDHTVDVKQVRREPYDTWVHESGKVVLVGDACHPMPAYGLQKAAMAIEDAAVLGNLFSRLRSRNNITFLLHAYQELRQTRCSYVQVREDMAHVCYPLRDGTAQDIELRDEELREKYLSKDITTEQFEKLWEMSAEIFRCLVFAILRWESILVICRYEVELEAESWWADFGPLMTPHEDHRLSTFMDLGVSRSTVVEQEPEISANAW